MIAGFSNSIAMSIIFRFFAGASIASICLNPSITGDLFAVKRRGVAMSLTSMIPILGSAVGPVAGGYISQYLNWRWTFWLMAIITACVSLLMVAVLKESYVPVIQRKALNKANPNREEISLQQKYFTGWNLATVRGACFARHTSLCYPEQFPYCTGHGLVLSNPLRLCFASCRDHRDCLPGCVRLLRGPLCSHIHCLE